MLTKLRRRMQDMKALTELMTSAEQFAREDGVDLPGSEHIVAAAICHSDGLAAEHLSPHGIDAAGLLAEVRRVHAEALGEIGVDGSDETVEGALPEPPRATDRYRASPSAQELLKRVAQNSSGFDSAAFVRACARRRRGTAAVALHNLGVNDADTSES